MHIKLNSQNLIDILDILKKKFFLDDCCEKLMFLKQCDIASILKAVHTSIYSAAAIPDDLVREVLRMQSLDSILAAYTYIIM